MQLKVNKLLYITWRSSRVSEEGLSEPHSGSGPILSAGNNLLSKPQPDYYSAYIEFLSLKFH